MIPDQTSHWLSPVEQETVIDAMLKYGILKISNLRDLPLKMGGTTDIYVNLRQARNHPEAIRFFGDMFANPVRRLRADRIAEIPQAVSCFAGYMSVATGLPMVTVRETPKGGRVSDANIIGEMKHGEHIALFDDVITDGASKFDGFKAITSKGARPTLVVAVDRQQGWQEKFTRLGINMPVWSGMTLHDIRSYLIRKGYMERCQMVKEMNNPIILALDGKSWDEILPIIDQLRPTGTIFKVNDLAVSMGTDTLLPKLHTYGRVMLDLKDYDIPNTVANRCKRVAIHSPWAVTVHASGGRDMIAAAVKSFESTTTHVLAVTVLTSFDRHTCTEVYHRLPLSQVKSLAKLAWEAGARGFVCSPLEATTLRNMYPKAIIVTPGVRSPGAEVGDQKRVDTPAKALALGANHVVMGRQILEAADPAAELKRVLEQELGIA